MNGGFGGMLSIRVRGGAEAAIAAAARVEIWKRATSLGGVESLIEHRASIEGADSPGPARSAAPLGRDRGPRRFDCRPRIGALRVRRATPDRTRFDDAIRRVCAVYARKNRPNVGVWLLVQSSHVRLTNVCNGCRSSGGPHAASWRKPNLGADPQGAYPRQINGLARLSDIGWADSQLDHCGFLWRRAFLSRAPVGETGIRFEPRRHQFRRVISGNTLGNAVNDRVEFDFPGCHLLDRFKRLAMLPRITVGPGLHPG